MTPGWRKFVAYSVAILSILTLAHKGADPDYAYAVVGALGLFAGSNGLEWLARRGGVL